MDSSEMGMKQQQKQQTKPTTPSPSPSNGCCTDTEDSNFLPMLSLCFLTMNTVIALVRAYSHRDFSMIAFVLFLYSGFLALFWCLNALYRLPINEDSPEKDRLKIAVWVLSTALNVGLAIRFAPLLFPIASVFLFTLATASSAVCFYFFFIYRENPIKKVSSGNCCSDQKGSKLFVPPAFEKVSAKNNKPIETTSPLDIV